MFYLTYKERLILLFLCLLLLLSVFTADFYPRDDNRRAVDIIAVPQGFPVNINKASQEDLERLPGIGEVTALRILDYRRSRGAIKNLKDLQNVRGIGPVKAEGLKEKISFK